MTHYTRWCDAYVSLRPQLAGSTPKGPVDEVRVRPQKGKKAVSHLRNGARVLRINLTELRILAFQNGRALPEARRNLPVGKGGPVLAKVFDRLDSSDLFARALGALELIANVIAI